MAFQQRRAARVIRSGGVIAYPTESVYGLGCNPLDAAAVLRILAIKRRSMDMGLILIAADFSQLEPYVRELDDAAMARVHDSWPGPATWLLPAAPACPVWLTGGRDTLAVRVSAHQPVIELCRAAGMPLVSTSANRSGQRPARSALQVRLRCPGVDLILHGPLGRLPRPTPIRDAATGKVLRAG